MAKCVSCRVETRREWLRDFARRSNRIAHRLQVAAFALLVVGLLAASLWRIENTSFPRVRSVETGWVAVIIFATALVAAIARAIVAVIARHGWRVGATVVDTVALPRHESAPAVHPASGSAYRSATQRAPLAPPPLCARHEALARQNQPHA